MKLEDFVAKSIYEFPTLYKDVDYQKSRLKVLGHVFLTCGNGFDLAYTKDPSKGGYYTYAKHRKRKLEYLRCYDAPYGKDKFPALPDDFFDVPIFYLYKADIEMYEVDRKRYGEKSQYLRVRGDIDRFALKRDFDGSMKLSLSEAKATYEFHPYPFSANYSAYGDLKKGGFLQPDWIQGLIDISRASLDYYTDPEKNKTDSYHPSRTIESSVRDFEKAASPDGVRELRKRYGYTDSDQIPTLDEITEHRNLSWQDFLARQIAILEEFLENQAK